MSEEIQELRLEIRDLVHKLEVNELKQQTRPQDGGASSSDKSKIPIWTAITGIIAIPTAVVYLLIQVNEFQAAPIKDEKQQKEIEKIEAETAKIKTDVLIAIKSLEAEANKNVPVAAELKTSITELREAVQSINNAGQAKFQKTILIIAIATFIFLFSGRFFNLIVDVISNIYETVTGTTRDFLYHYADHLHAREREIHEQRRTENSASGIAARESQLAALRKRNMRVDGVLRIIRIVDSVVSFILHRIAYFVLNIFVFFALYVPIFDYVGTNLGWRVSSGEIIDLLVHFRFADVARKLIEVVGSV